MRKLLSKTENGWSGVLPCGSEIKIERSNGLPGWMIAIKDPLNFAASCDNGDPLNEVRLNRKELVVFVAAKSIDPLTKIFSRLRKEGQ